MNVWNEAFQGGHSRGAAIAYEYLPTVQAMQDRIVEIVNDSRAARVLVVGGYTTLRDLEPRDFRSHRLLLNTPRSITWLLKACDHSRRSADRLVFITHWPRQWNPPRTKLVHSGGMVGKADGRLGGDVIDFEAPGESLALLPPSNTSRQVEVVFMGLYATSYYAEVCSSQVSLTGVLAAVTVVSGSEDVHLFDEFYQALEATTDNSRRQAILDDASSALEELCRSTENGRQRREFDGDCLQPTKDPMFVAPL